jgi:hypothetical protein
MIALLLALATYAAPTPQVDRVEINHYSDKFTQVIFWSWSEQRKRYDVRAWKMVEHESQLPRLSNGRYVMRWTEFGQLREVTANRCNETRTKHDPELAEREILSQEQRRPLFESGQ